MPPLKRARPYVYSDAEIDALLAAALALPPANGLRRWTYHYLFGLIAKDIQQVTPGSSEAQVKAALGTPTSTATVGNGTAYYYISSVEGQKAFFSPTEKDRRVLAVYFGPLGSVDRVANYGLKDGKVFDFVKQETPSHARDESLLKALFRNLGVKQLGLE